MATPSYKGDGDTLVQILLGNHIHSWEKKNGVFTTPEEGEDRYWGHLAFPPEFLTKPLRLHGHFQRVNLIHMQVWSVPEDRQFLPCCSHAHIWSNVTGTLCVAPRHQRSLKKNQRQSRKYLLGKNVKWKFEGSRNKQGFSLQRLPEWSNDYQWMDNLSSCWMGAWHLSVEGKLQGLENQEVNTLPCDDYKFHKGHMVIPAANAGLGETWDPEPLMCRETPSHSPSSCVSSHRDQLLKCLYWPTSFHPTLLLWPLSSY